MYTAMDDSGAGEQSTGGRSASGLLRYPLRSARKEKQTAGNYSNPSSVSTSKRGKSAFSGVGKSVSLLNVSSEESKEKSTKPPRRFSVPSNSNPSPASATIITPTPELRSKGSKNSLSDATKSSARRKFSVLTSPSYWLSQIKLSESAAKHSVSLGFFKLAYDAGCEPLQRIDEELKSYVHRYDLSELGDLVNDLFECYDKNLGNEQPWVSSPRSESEVPNNEGDRSSENDVVDISLSTSVDAENTKPKPINENAGETARADELEKKISRSSLQKNTSSSKLGSDLKELRDAKNAKMSGNLKKQVSAQDRGKKKKKPGKIPALHGEGTTLNTPPEEAALQEDKENTGASTEMKGIILGLEI